MTCRVGMTSNLDERLRYWRTQCPNLRNVQVLWNNLTYDEAQLRERQEGSAPRVRIRRRWPAIAGSRLLGILLRVLNDGDLLRQHTREFERWRTRGSPLRVSVVPFESHLPWVVQRLLEGSR